MSIVIKGYVTKKLFPKDNSDSDFKIYGFAPSLDSIKEVIMNDFGNITIKGIMPDLIVESKEYEIEVEYERKGKYESYVVNRFLNKMIPTQGKEAFLFLENMCGETTANNILNVYPDFIEMVLEEKHSDIKHEKIKGVGAIRLNKIIEKVFENIKFYEIIITYKDYELTLTQVKKLYGKYKSFDNLHQKMVKNPYDCLCNIGGIGFKTADKKILKNNPDFLNSPHRMIESILYILSDNESKGNTWINIDDLYANCKELSPQCMQYFNETLGSSKRIYFKDNKVGRYQTYLCEVEIANRINDILSEDNIWSNIDYSKFTTINGIELTVQQVQLNPTVCQSNCVVLAGVAGSGKSFSSKSLIDMLDAYNFTSILLAPTGRASDVLSNYTGKPASTIHRGLGCMGDTFTHDENNKFDVDIIIVDEASMIDCFLMRALLRAVDYHKTKILFICDPAQIPSVGAGNCIQDIIHSKKVPVILLDKVFRYEEGGLSYVATKTRLGENFLQKGQDVQYFGKDNDFIFIDDHDKETIVKTAIDVYKKLIDSGVSKEDIVILSAYNKGEYGTYKLNDMVQDYINPYNETLETNYIRDGKPVVFRKNDKVIQTKNKYDVELMDDGLNDTGSVTDVFNGEDGHVCDISHNGTLYVDYGSKIIHYTKEDMNELLLGYSISCHKSQGSSYPYVIVLTPPAHKFFLNRNLLYVAYTRAKKKVINIGTADTIRSALKKSENLSRQTYLLGLLSNSVVKTLSC